MKIMLEIAIDTLPIILLLLWGYSLKKFKILSSKDGSRLFILSFFVGLPALVFISIVNTEIKPSMLILALFPIIEIVLLLLLMLFFRKTIFKSISTKTFAAIALGAMILNTGFQIPFIESFYKEEGLSLYSAVILGNTIGVFTIAYAFAVSYNEGAVNAKYVLKKILISPPIWALLLALIVKSINISTPEPIYDALTLAGRFVSPITLLALGLKIEFKLTKFHNILIGLLSRFGLGLLIGIIFVNLFGLTGIEATIVLLTSIAPIGFNSITFADLEDLDSETASIQVSFGIIIGLILMPIMIEILNTIYL